MRIATSLLLLSLVALSMVGSAAAMWSETLKINGFVSMGWSDPEIARICATYCFLQVNSSCHHMHSQCHCGCTCYTSHKCHGHCKEHMLLTLRAVNKRSVIMDIGPSNYSRLVSALFIRVVNRGTIPVVLTGVSTTYSPSSITLKRRVFILPRSLCRGTRCCLPLPIPRFPRLDKDYVIYPGKHICIAVVYSVSGIRGKSVTVTTVLNFSNHLGEE